MIRWQQIGQDMNGTVANPQAFACVRRPAHDSNQLPQLQHPRFMNNVNGPACGHRHMLGSSTSRHRHMHSVRCAATSPMCGTEPARLHLHAHRHRLGSGTRCAPAHAGHRHMLGTGICWAPAHGCMRWQQLRWGTEASPTHLHAHWHKHGHRHLHGYIGRRYALAVLRCRPYSSAMYHGSHWTELYVRHRLAPAQSWAPAIQGAGIGAELKLYT